MRRDTRLDRLPLATVVALCVFLVAWMGRDGSPRGALLAAGGGWTGPDGQLTDVPADIGQEPPGFLGGGRTPGELLERVLDPASGRVPVVPEDDPLSETSDRSQDGPPRLEPFRLIGPNDVVLVEGAVLGDSPEGLWEFRHPDDSRRARGVFRGGVPDGLWVAWHEDSIQERVRLNYEEGVALGERVEWWPNGNPYLKGSYLAGRREGSWRYWHENGQLRSEGRYHAGLREGPWNEWHANGTLDCSVTYQAGQPEGHYRAWYPDGQLAQEGWYVNGLREGEWVFLTPEGKRDARSGYYVAGAQRVP